LLKYSFLGGRCFKPLKGRAPILKTSAGQFWERSHKETRYEETWRRKKKNKKGDPGLLKHLEAGAVKGRLEVNTPHAGPRTAFSLPRSFFVL
jgi:hypothetical protein